MNPEQTPPAPPAPPATPEPTQTSPAPPAPEAAAPVAPAGIGTPAPAAPPAPTAPAAADLTSMPANTAPEAPVEEKVLPADWPCSGYTGPQPWEAANPPEITHNQRMITSGTHGPEVVELCALLARVGISTPLSTGQNPHAIYDAPTAAAVRQFSSQFGVTEDPQIVDAMTADVVGPWLWEALFRAAHKAQLGES